MKFRPAKGARCRIPDSCRDVIVSFTNQERDLQVKSYNALEVEVENTIPGSDAQCYYLRGDGELILEESDYQEPAEPVMKPNGTAKSDAVNAHFASLKVGSPAANRARYESFIAGWDACEKHLATIKHVRISREDAQAVIDELDKAEASGYYAKFVPQNNFAIKPTGVAAAQDANEQLRKQLETAGELHLGYVKRINELLAEIEQLRDGQRSMDRALKQVIKDNHLIAVQILAATPGQSIHVHSGTKVAIGDGSDWMISGHPDDNGGITYSMFQKSWKPVT